MSFYIIYISILDIYIVIYGITFKREICSQKKFFDSRKYEVYRHIVSFWPWEVKSYISQSFGVNTVWENMIMVSEPKFVESWFCDMYSFNIFFKSLHIGFTNPLISKTEHFFSKIIFFRDIDRFFYWFSILLFSDVYIPVTFLSILFFNNL